MSSTEVQARAATRTLPGATVLQIVPALVNDHAARAAVNVALALLRSGARALVASAGGRLVGELQAVGGEWLQTPTASHNPITLRTNARKFSDFVTNEHVDIVHAYSGATAWSARSAIRDRAILITSYYGTPQPRTSPIGLYQGALARGARVFVDSGYAADLIIKRHEIPPERVIVMPRGVDTTRFDPMVVSAERLAVLRHGWRVRPGVRVILVPGRLAPDKGQLTAIDAARILANGGLRGVVFIIAGTDRPDPEYARAIDERIAVQGLGGMVRRIGHCSDMPAAYAVADATIVPAIEPTTYNQTAIEAQAMARPVIASALGALPEIVQAPPLVPESARTGWLVAPSDPVDLARAIAGVLSLSNPSRQAIGVRARAAAEEFSQSRIAAATLGVYTSLLERGH